MVTKCISFFLNRCNDFKSNFPCGYPDLCGIDLNVKEESNGLQAEMIMHC